MPRSFPVSLFVPAAVRRAVRRLLAPAPPYARLWQRASFHWLLGGADRDADTLTVHGWAVAPPALRPHLRFLLNDGSVEAAEYPLPRPDVAAARPGVPGAGESGFVLRAAYTPGPLTVRLIDRRTGREPGPHYPAYHLPAEVGPLPDDGRRERVIGRSTAFEFGMGGYTAFRRLEAALRAATGRRFADLPRVLDWGCGSGRVGRYFLAEVPGVRLTGADVDPDNVGWCRANLPGGAWAVLPLRPPTALPAGGFDLVFGVSVLTHLREADQFAWLAELRRLLRPGGVALLTFHGEASVAWAGLSADRWRALRRHGICDQSNTLYDAALGEADYYRDTFHTAGYVRREWGRYFDTLAVEPCAVAHQDLAVLRRPG